MGQVLGKQLIYIMNMTKDSRFEYLFIPSKLPAVYSAIQDYALNINIYLQGIAHLE